MATTTYGRSDSLTVSLWAKKLESEVLKETFATRFMGTTSGSLIHKKTETSKGDGDRVTFGLRMQLSGAGVTEAQVLEGNEEALTTYSDALVINELAHAVKVASQNTVDAQRVTFDLRDEAMSALTDWFAGRIDQTFMSHIAGDTLAGGAGAAGVYTGNNATVAASSTRIYRPNSRANDGALTTGDDLTVGIIDKAVEIAKTASPMIRPIRVNGGEYYVLFIHPAQTTSLRASAATSGSWADIQKARIMGGEGDDNLLFKGGSYVGMWNGVLIYESTRIPQGINSGAYVANTRRAVLCGAQAAAMAVGSKFNGDQMFKWREETFDYGRRLGVSVQCVWGLKKVQFNSVDYGTIVLPTLATAAA